MVEFRSMFYCWSPNDIYIYIYIFDLGLLRHSFKLGLGVDPRIKVFRNKLSLIPQKDKVKLDAWTCKSFLSFIKMKTHKRLGSKAP